MPNIKVTHLAVVVLVLAFSIWTSSPIAVSAQSLSDYFQISYDSTILSQQQVSGSSPFNATVAGRATCHKDLPMSVSEATITMSVLAQNVVTGGSVTLNPGYTVSIKPFPSKNGDAAELHLNIPLRFPMGINSGNYSVTAKITDAKVKVSLIWIPVTEYLPGPQTIGLVTYKGVSTGSTATKPASTSPVQAVSQNFTAKTQAPANIPINSTTAVFKPGAPSVIATSRPYVPWWVWLLVAAAIISTAMNVGQMVRRNLTSRTKPSKP